MQKVLGLDIGISSVGHSVIELDEEQFSGKFLDLGVRIFTAAEQPKTGASLALPRREARSARRRLARRSGRLYNIRKFLLEENFITQEQIEKVYNAAVPQIDVWDLRKAALGRVLTNDEFYRVLMHIAKRRGFKSIRKSEEAKTEGDLLKSIKDVTDNFERGQYRTIGEMFASEYTNGIPKRNKAGKYNKSISRSLLEQEIGEIFKSQRELGSNIASENIEEGYRKIAFYQRPLKSIEIKTACTLEPNETRAPKCAYTAEIFTALNKLVNLRIIDEMGNIRFLCGEEIERAVSLAHKLAKVTYKQLRKELCIGSEMRFWALNYNKKDSKGSITDPENETLLELKNYHSIKKAILNNIKLGQVYFETIQNNEEFFNNIAYTLTCEKSDEAIIKRLKDYGCNNEVIESVKDLSMSKTAPLSIKAMKKLIPYMMKGYKCSEACEMAGYERVEREKEKQSFLPVLSQEELTLNPVVNRAVSQTRKVVNALIKKYGAFDTIIIEMSRDLSKSVNERRSIQKAQEEFRSEKEQARQRCLEAGLNPDSPKSNLLKFRLWEEQGGYCVYSGKYIDPKRLADYDYTDIDHIIPYSRSFDDSLNNKVLCLTDENRQKGKLYNKYFRKETITRHSKVLRSYQLYNKYSQM